MFERNVLHVQGVPQKMYKRTHIEHCDFVSHCPNHSFFLTAIVIIINVVIITILIVSHPYQ